MIPKPHTSINKYPTNAPPKTTQALFTLLKPNVTTILKAAIKMVRQSVIVSLAIEKQMEAMMATDATLTASKKAENSTELRIFFTNGFNKATNRNAGTKIATVETTAPVHPLI